MRPLIDLFKHKELIWLLGYSEIKIRYSRTAVGQWWITLSQAIFISSIGVVWAKLWNVPLHKYLPILAMGTVFWGFLTGLIGGSPTSYLKYRAYILDKPNPKELYIIADFLNNVVILGHNFLFTILILIFFADLSFDFVRLIVSLVSISLTVGWVIFLSLIFATLGSKFRDLDNIVGSLLNVSFFVSPVMWSIERFSETNQMIVMWVNPFASSLTSFRNLFTETVDIKILLNGVASDCLLLMIVAFFYGVFIRKEEQKVAFWIL